MRIADAAGSGFDGAQGESRARTRARRLRARFAAPRGSSRFLRQTTRGARARDVSPSRGGRARVVLARAKRRRGYFFRVVLWSRERRGVSPSPRAAGRFSRRRGMGSQSDGVCTRVLVQ
eukprot:30850-Pelagococcus_subviridis.AAC.9